MSAAGLSSSGKPPRVALVHDWLTGMRGGEKVLEQIARLFPEAPIYTLFHFRGAVSPELEGHTVHVSSLQRLPGLRRHYRSLLPLFPSAIERFDLRGYDLVISTSHCVAKGVRAPDGRHLCYCHTPVRYAWDQRDAYFPNDGAALRWLRGLLLDRLQRWDRRTADRVHAYAANSTFVQQRIERFWGRTADVVHPPVDIEAVSRWGSSRPAGNSAGEPGFLLSVAALSPYKRHDVAMRAAAMSGRKLVIVGEGPQRAQLEQLARQLRQRPVGNESPPILELLGRVSDAELGTLLHAADAFVQPGIEDFGIAAVEALAAGTPVVASAAGGVLDIVEDAVHGQLFAPDSGAEGLVAALDRLEASPPDPEVLRARAERFSRSAFRTHLVDFFARHIELDLFRQLDLYG
jgi:glycosyltransferase involved in cell wall biosynthesis